MLPATIPCNDLLKNFYFVWMEAKHKLKPPDLPKHMHMPTQSPRQEWNKPRTLFQLCWEGEEWRQRLQLNCKSNIFVLLP